MMYRRVMPEPVVPRHKDTWEDRIVYGLIWLFVVVYASFFATIQYVGYKAPPLEQGGQYFQDVIAFFRPGWQMWAVCWLYKLPGAAFISYGWVLYDTNKRRKAEGRKKEWAPRTQAVVLLMLGGQLGLAITGQLAFDGTINQLLPEEGFRLGLFDRLTVLTVTGSAALLLLRAGWRSIWFKHVKGLWEVESGRA